jgi:hypothetical protein
VSVSVPPIEVAGRVVADPAGVVDEYVQNNRTTLRRYDGVAGTRDALTPEVVAAAGRASRRRAARVRWIVERAATAPWGEVPQDALLRDADPFERDGLYDKAARLHHHFTGERPHGVPDETINKCLYLMRPGLFPSLDGRTMTRYRHPALVAARELAKGTGRPPARRAYWAAIRLDLLRNAAALDDLRSWIRASDHADVAGDLSDVRLLDILVWQSKL